MKPGQEIWSKANHSKSWTSSAGSEQGDLKTCLIVIKQEGQAGAYLKITGLQRPTKPQVDQCLMWPTEM